MGGGGRKEKKKKGGADDPSSNPSPYRLNNHAWHSGGGNEKFKKKSHSQNGKERKIRVQEFQYCLYFINTFHFQFTIKKPGRPIPGGERGKREL